MTSDLTSVQVVALMVAATAGVWDLRTRRIPNVLTLGAAASGLVYHVVTGGLNSGLASVGGLLIGAVPMFLQFALGGMGAGDVKLMGALGAWLGPVEAFWLVLFTGMAGGVMALVIAGAHGYLKQACHNLLSLFFHWQVAGLKPLPALTLEAGSSLRLAYAVPIFAGTVVTCWLQ
jgi:prepilin peptidase CpaA